MIRSLVLVLFALGSAFAEEKLFSGPQVGEKLKPFKVKGVFDDVAGKDLDFVTKADGKPILLVFVHELNRPSLGMTRVLMNYAVTRSKDLVSGIVWLTEDATEAETKLKQIRNALPKDGAIGISPDGKEGPGSYGLNRNVTLTILVGKENKVTANFPLVQPSIEADLPKILKAIVAVAGGEAPKVEDLLPKGKDAPKDRPAEVDPKMATHLRAMIQLKATPEDVEKAAKEIEKMIKENEAVKKEIARISTTLVNGGKLDNYGTEKAQEYLKKWAKEYGALAPKPKERPKKDGDK
ncbi:MAG: hypothetical protein EXS09_03945 [Gemmataceae bacterium]|nr:hypothetical protein [Gemmataceae bacterium]